jgi:guanylate kinase
MFSSQVTGKAIIFSAPSGAGKTTLVRYLLSEPALMLAFSVSATSRECRGEEVDGKDYHFLTTEEFQNKIDNNEFVEWEEVYAGTRYGTLKSEVERIWKSGKHVIFDVDVVGGLPEGIPPPLIDPVVAQIAEKEGFNPPATESTYCLETTLKSL